jgi:hypothetical protein
MNSAVNVNITNRALIVKKLQEGHTICQDIKVIGTGEIAKEQCCGSGMFYPGSGSLTFLSRIRGVKKQLKNKDSLNLTKKHTPWIRDPEKFIPDQGGKKAPDLGSRISDPGSGSATLQKSF